MIATTTFRILDSNNVFGSMVFRITGDAADMAMIELVDFNEIYGKGIEEGAAKKTRHSRRSGGAKKEEVAAAPAQEIATETEAAAPEATEETA